ncbi:hypothetical protein LC612_30450 [Nostoc sp. CHAB 5834]|nr:hypothetical protein [Nostoc sp. CHAB 5834]
MNYIVLSGSIHMVVNGRARSIAKSDKLYEEVATALKEAATAEEIQAILDRDLIKLEAAIQLTPNMTLKGGRPYYKEEPLTGVIGDKLIELHKEGFPLEPLARVVENIKLNPSNNVNVHLYPFLEYGKNPLTEDGCFLAYKAVTGEFLDYRTESIDNSVGQIVSMPRHLVDDDPYQTCSHGLHVCSFDYLASFARRSGKVVIVKVNPQDVVAVPRDYNNTKMRVCRYEVVGVYDGYYEQQGDRLSDVALSVSTDGLTEGTFGVHLVNEDGELESTLHNRLHEAETHYYALVNNIDELGNVQSVLLHNMLTGTVLQRYAVEESDQCSYELYGVTHDNCEELLCVKNSLQAAVAAALEVERYETIFVKDPKGNLVKTIS